MPLILELIVSTPLESKENQETLEIPFLIQSAFILDVKNTNNAGENGINTYINDTKKIIYNKD